MRDSLHKVSWPIVMTLLLYRMIWGAISLFSAGKRPDLTYLRGMLLCCVVLLQVYLFLERDSVSRGGAEGVGERIPSRIHTISTEPYVGLDPTSECCVDKDFG